jgi:hypothetical protein
VGVPKGAISCRLASRANNQVAWRPAQWSVAWVTATDVGSTKGTQHCGCRSSVIGCYTEHRPFGEPTKGSMGKATPNRDKNDQPHQPSICLSHVFALVCACRQPWQQALEFTGQVEAEGAERTAALHTAQVGLHTRAAHKPNTLHNTSSLLGPHAVVAASTILRQVRGS